MFIDVRFHEKVGGRDSGLFSVLFTLKSCCICGVSRVQCFVRAGFAGRRSRNEEQLQDDHRLGRTGRQEKECE